MESILFRTGSGPINSSLFLGSPRFAIPLRHASFSGSENLEFSPLLHSDVNKNCRKISRAISEPQAIIRLRSISTGSQTFPVILPEVEEESSLPDEDITRCIGSSKFAEKCFDSTTRFPASGIAVEEPQFPGAGSGNGRDHNGFGSKWSSNGDNNNERNEIGAHYQKMLKSNPNDPLLLRNYGKFLHEVEGDIVKAEEYYGRAILANPGDGELLSLYGKLIWDTNRDGERAKTYFDQAVVASPDDCMVMGSYAQFMWEAEAEEEEQSGSKVSVPAAQPSMTVF